MQSDTYVTYAYERTTLSMHMHTQTRESLHVHGGTRAPGRGRRWIRAASYVSVVLLRNERCRSVSRAVLLHEIPPCLGGPKGDVCELKICQTMRWANQKGFVSI